MGGGGVERLGALGVTKTLAKVCRERQVDPTAESDNN